MVCKMLQKSVKIQQSTSLSVENHKYQSNTQLSKIFVGSRSFKFGIFDKLLLKYSLTQGTTETSLGKATNIKPVGKIMWRILVKCLDRIRTTKFCNIRKPCKTRFANT